MPDKIRVVIADDHGIVRNGMKALLRLEGDMEIVGEAANAEEAIALCESLSPNVLLLDVSMPGRSGLEALPEIVERFPSCRVLILTGMSEEKALLPVLKAGGAGYVPKTAAADELVDAIRTVYRGNVHLRPEDLQRLLVESVPSAGEVAAPQSQSQLTERELEVLKFTAQGFSSREIGERIFVSPKTVDTYRERTMRKLGLSRRSELVAYAIENGLL